MSIGDWEFRLRFWTIALVFCVGFEAYAIDHVNVVARLARWLDLPPAERPLAMHVAFGAGAALTVVAALVRTWAAAYLRSEVVHDGVVRSERLVADGPYRHVRNPLYLGTLLLAASIGLMASGLGWLVIVGGMALVTRRLIAREEAALLTSQGAAYRAYLDAVPRLVPSIRPRVPAGDQPAHWGQAFAGEAPMWAFASAAIVLAVTLDRKPAFQLILLSLIVYVVQWAIGQRRAGARP